jgi:hypothetical protein
MIDAALEALWTTAPVMAWAGALQQHLRRALDGRGPEAEAAVVVALAERATHVRRHPPAEHPQLWWSYVQNLVQLLRSEPVLRQADFEALLEQMIDERGVMDLPADMLTTLLGRLEAHLAAGNALSPGVERRLRRFTAEARPDGRSGAAAAWIQASKLLGTFDPVAEMRRRLGDDRFGRGTVEAWGTGRFPIYDRDPLAAEHRDLEAYLEECAAHGFTYTIKSKQLTTLQTVLGRDREVQRRFALAALYRIAWDLIHARHYNALLREAMNVLLRRRLPFSEPDILFIFRAVVDGVVPVYVMSFLNFLKSVEVFIGEHGLSPKLTGAFEAFLGRKELASYTDASKIRLKLRSMLQQEAPADRTFFLNERDAFGRTVNAYLRALPAEGRQAWSELLQHCGKANGGKPSRKYLKTAAAGIEGVDPGAFSSAMASWLDVLADQGQVEPTNAVIARGLLWWTRWGCSNGNTGAWIRRKSPSARGTAHALFGPGGCSQLSGSLGVAGRASLQARGLQARSR